MDKGSVYIKKILIKKYQLWILNFSWLPNSTPSVKNVINVTKRSMWIGLSNFIFPTKGSTQKASLGLLAYNLKHFIVHLNLYSYFIVSSFCSWTIVKLIACIWTSPSLSLQSESRIRLIAKLNAYGVLNSLLHRWFSLKSYQKDRMLLDQFSGASSQPLLDSSGVPYIRFPSWAFVSIQNVS